MDWKKYYKIENFIKELKENNKEFNLIIGEQKDREREELKGIINCLNKKDNVPVFFIEYKENKSEILKLYEGLRHFPILISYENKTIDFVVKI
jgi:hypothetical protein